MGTRSAEKRKLQSKTSLPAVLLMGLLLLDSCTPVQTTSSGAVGVERKQYMLVSEQQVEQSAAIAYAQETQKATQKGALNINKALTDRVRRIAGRLIPQTAAFRPDAPGWKWEVNVQTSEELNAYCMPGGKIMVYTGIIEKLKLTDDELATVMGHEISHALREHGRERVSRQMGQEAVLSLGAALLGVDSDAAVNLANQVATVTFQLPHSREQETEADRLGLELMARAGYNPNAAISVWQKMSASGDGAPPQFLSTHPSSATRIADLQALIPRVMPLYESARAKG
jgi:predicted Zn-dependent protease